VIREKFNKAITFLLIFIFGKSEIAKKIYPESNSDFLIICCGSIQNALNITPLIKVLKETYGISINILTDDKCAKVFFNNSSVENVIITSSEIKEYFKILLRLRSNRFRALIMPDDSPSNPAIYAVSLLRADFKIGFDGNFSKLLTHKIPLPDKNTVHPVDRNLELTAAFDMAFDKGDLNIIYEPTKRSKLSLETYRITHDLIHKPTAVINISSELEIGFWGVDSYKRLLRFLRNYEFNIIIASSIGNMKEAEDIAEKKYLIYYDTDFDAYAQLIKSANFVFTPDSFTIQLSAAFKVPVFCLFVQHNSSDMLNVPYNSDFDFCLTEKPSLDKLSFGKVLNSFVPYFEYVYQRYNPDRD
jgi:ADP-heptose:LPS heptosyltransferase